MSSLDSAVDCLVDAVERLDAALRGRRARRDETIAALERETAKSSALSATAADRLDAVISRLQSVIEH